VGARRVAVVTGASAGIGLEIARGLSTGGYRMVLAVRDRERGEAAARDIANTSGAAAPDVAVVDFASPTSIRHFASEFLAKHPSLDVLVNNAGTWSLKRKETAEGIELVWATNQLGYFLTTELLKPALLRAPSARIVNVASELARDLDQSDVNFKRRRYTGVASYAQSKQANRMWTRALSRRLAGTGVTANSMHPGGVATGLFGKGGGFLARAAGRAVSLFGRTPKAGADTAVWLAASPDVAGRTGGFYFDRKERRCRFNNLVEEERLFGLCAAMSGVDDPSPRPA
jgi:NAD(P)-dependent dehydrogenase (short-subunit alcohol dehydrogenase family)